MMEKKVNSKIVNMVMVGVVTALIIVFSQISIPMPSGVPITLQTFAVALCGYILHLKLAPVSVICYITLGAVGLPVFSNFRGGVGMLVGMTGGFIWGFIIFAAFCGFGMRFKNKILPILFGVAGLIICHLLGVVQFSAVTTTPFLESAMLVSIPYMLKDVISVVVAYPIALLLISRLTKAKLIS